MTDPPVREPDGAGGYVDEGSAGPARTDWQQRVERAKRDGSCHTDEDEQYPMSTRQRVRRFFAAFGVALLLCSVIKTATTWVHGDPFGLDLLLDVLVSGGFPALLAGTFFAFPRGKPRTTSRRR